MKEYVIKKGKHRSGIYFRPHVFRNKLEREVMFDETSNYWFGNADQQDINKLFGLSYGYHQHDSVRFGWRSFGKYSSKIEILAYCYVDGVRLHENGHNLLIGTVDINKMYKYRLQTTANRYIFKIFKSDHMIYRHTIKHNTNLPPIGYYLWPYFGGNQGASHDIKIKMK